MKWLSLHLFLLTLIVAPLSAKSQEASFVVVAQETLPPSYYFGEALYRAMRLVAEQLITASDAAIGGQPLLSEHQRKWLLNAIDNKEVSATRNSNPSLAKVMGTWDGGSVVFYSSLDRGTGQFLDRARVAHKMMHFEPLAGHQHMADRHSDKMLDVEWIPDCENRASEGETLYVGKFIPQERRSLPQQSLQKAYQQQDMKLFDQLVLTRTPHRESLLDFVAIPFERIGDLVPSLQTFVNKATALESKILNILFRSEDLQAQTEAFQLILAYEEGVLNRIPRAEALHTQLVSAINGGFRPPTSMTRDYRRLRSTLNGISDVLSVRKDVLWRQISPL